MTQAIKADAMFRWKIRLDDAEHKLLVSSGGVRASNLKEALDEISSDVDLDDPRIAYATIERRRKV